MIAKTGTAEYGNDDPLKTHAWMIAAQGDLAVAVFVNTGQSGSKTAGPLLKEFLEGLAEPGQVDLRSSASCQFPVAGTRFGLRQRLTGMEASPAPDDVDVVWSL